MSTKRRRILSTRDAVHKIIIAWIAMGLTTKEIALNLKIAEKTVAWHWDKIRQRYSLRCYADATRLAMVTGLIPMEV